jgi:hypothetical protein
MGIDRIGSLRVSASKSKHPAVVVDGLKRRPSSKQRLSQLLEFPVCPIHISTLVKEVRAPLLTRCPGRQTTHRIRQRGCTPLLHSDCAIERAAKLTRIAPNHSEISIPRCDLESREHPFHRIALFGSGLATEVAAICTRISYLTCQDRRCRLVV